MSPASPLARRHAGRAPLFKSLRRLFGLAHVSNQKNQPSSAELIDMGKSRGWSRRDFLKSSAIAATTIASGSWFAGCTAPVTGPNAARVVIVGGGIAGLNAAYTLRKRGIIAPVYEASSRTGGRMYSTRDLLGPGLVTELGGEFVDSNHTTMLQLAREFGLQWLDVQGPGEEQLIAEAFFFDGRHYTEAQVVEAFRPLATAIAADFDSLGDIVDFENDGGAADLDRMSLSQYLDRIGASGWLRKLLDVAFVTEFGLESDEQSALNLIFMISTDLSSGHLALFGDSDERYKVIGGNQRITEELAVRVADQIHLEQRLLAIRPHAAGYRLVFDHSGRTTEVDSDVVLLTLPFTLLRQVELDVELPEWKRRAIDELGYGMNAKFFMGMRSRLWRTQGHSGNLFSDEPFQLAWDSSRRQPGVHGSLSCFTGGNATTELGRGTSQAQATRLLASLDKAFPGIAGEFTGVAERFFWPTHPFTRASYACYKPGQWTTIANAEGKRVGNLYFAGEHCSYDFQGFMNGGAETGEAAGMAIAKRVRGRRKWVAA